MSGITAFFLLMMLAGVLLIGVAWLLAELDQAPNGHEDQDGFHYDDESDER